jgi:hypothetical protein
MCGYPQPSVAAAVEKVLCGLPILFPQPGNRMESLWRAGVPLLRVMPTNI